VPEPPTRAFRPQPVEPDPALTADPPSPAYASSDLLVTPSRAAVGAGFVAVVDHEDSDFNTFPSQRVDLAISWHQFTGPPEAGLLTFQAKSNLFDSRYQPVYQPPGQELQQLGGSAVLGEGPVAPAAFARPYALTGDRTVHGRRAMLNSMGEPRGFWLPGVCSPAGAAGAARSRANRPWQGPGN
jgi:hypothetical protein